MSRHRDPPKTPFGLWLADRRNTLKISPDEFESTLASALKLKTTTVATYVRKLSLDPIFDLPSAEFRAEMANVLRVAAEDLNPFFQNPTIRGLRGRKRRRDIIDNNGGYLESYGSWNDPAIQKLILSAAKSIVFVDTWFDDEAPNFCSLLYGWSDSHDKEKLKFKMYLLSELGLFGIQRLKEISLLNTSSDDELKTTYRDLFTAGIVQARFYLNEVELEIYRCDFMPGIRLMIIDEQKYVFSWFPLGKLSAGNACFCLSADSPTKGDQVAIEHLKRQLAAIQNNSTLIETRRTEETPRSG